MYHSDLINYDIVAMLAVLWPDFFEGLEGSLNASVPQVVHGDSAAANHSTANTDLLNLKETAFTSAPTLPTRTFTAQSTYSYPGDVDARAMFAHAFPDTGSIAPQLVDNPHLTQVSSCPTESAAAISDLVVSTSGSKISPGFQDELAGILVPGQFSYHPTSSAVGGGNEGNLVAPELSTGMSRLTSYPMVWPDPASLESVTVALGKRLRDVSHEDGVPVMMNRHEMPAQKRVRSDNPNGIFKAAWSASGIHHKSVTRIPKPKINAEPRGTGRGIEGLAIPDSLGIHHQSLLGSSLQQGWAVEAADRKLTWAEGSVEEIAQCDDGTARQQEQEEVQQECFDIPKDLNTGYRALLMATQADRERGSICEIRCRLCPNTKFKRWGEFKRHCDSNEAHPLTIYFCEYCGDYFARSDARDRHHNKRPPQCQGTRVEADEKRRTTQREHDEFIRSLEEYLTTGENSVGMSFSKIIKDLYPDSSKKRTRR